MWQFYNCICKHFLRPNKKNTVFLAFTLNFSDNWFGWQFEPMTVTTDICYSFQGCAIHITTCASRQDELLWLEYGLKCNAMQHRYAQTWVCRKEICSTSNATANEEKENHIYEWKMRPSWGSYDHRCVGLRNSKQQCSRNRHKSYGVEFQWGANIFAVLFFSDESASSSSFWWSDVIH